MEFSDIPIRDTDWSQGNCVNLPLIEVDNLFHNPDNADIATNFCYGCPIFIECGEVGRGQTVSVFGGLKPDEREPFPEKISEGQIHGTYTQYVYGCRCDDCCQAKRIKAIQYSRRRRSAGNTNLGRVPTNLPTRTPENPL